MKIGVMSFNTEYTMRADRLAAALEERGFESLWLPEHTHIPVPENGDPKTGMPVKPDGEFLEVEYRHMADPLTSLAASAAVTQDLMLGTCICLVNQHHPVNLAKSVATLDRLADGRFLFGVGAGWYVAEMLTHAIEFESRWPQLRERLDVMKTLWREEKASYQGEFFELAESWQYPKPVKPEGPPVIVGSLDTPFGREQVARFGDGWLPLTFSVERTARSIDDVKRRMEAHGRDPQGLEVSLFFLADKKQSKQTIDQAREIGAHRTILRLPVVEEVELLKVLDEYALVLNA